MLPEAAGSFPLNQFDVSVPRPAEVPVSRALATEQRRIFLPGDCPVAAGVSLEQAREAMTVIDGGYRAAHPNNVDAPSQIEVVPLLEDAVGQQRGAI